MFFRRGDIMRNFYVFVFIVFLATSLVLATQSFAQKSGSRPCEQATSTSAVYDCVNKKKQDAQDHMGGTYRRLMEHQEDGQRQALSESQKNWILYRDAHCRWEAGLSGTAALDRAYELSCVSRLTEMRNLILEAVIAEQEDAAPREFADQPRWMNVLTQSYPDVYWRFGEWVSEDLNCNGTDEKVMTGLSVTHIDEPVMIDAGNVEKHESIRKVSLMIAISENPDTGIPKVVVHKFPIEEKREVSAEDGKYLCRPSVSIAVSGEMNEESCDRTLVVDDRVCAPIAIGWDGATFSVVKTELNEESL